MALADLPRSASSLFNDLVIRPLAHLFHALSQSDRRVAIALLVAAVALGFVIGRRRAGLLERRRGLGAWRFPTFQNNGEVGYPARYSHTSARPAII